MAKFNIAVRSVTIMLAIIGVAGIVQVYQIQAQSTAAQSTEPANTPPGKPYAHTVAATGIFEAWGENVAIGVPVPGLIKEVAVGVNDKVKAGQVILRLDDQEIQAALVATKAAVATAKAEQAVAQATLAKSEDFLKRMASLKDARGVSQDEVATREFETRIAQAQVLAADARLAKAEADIQSQTILLERLTVKAPRDGQILQVNIRAGEYASTQGSTKAMMVLGDLSQLQVRADVDEQNALRVKPNQKAVCYLKGDTKVTLPLEFVRIEPYIIPKVSLTGASAERVDTRVLQVIFKYKPTDKVSTFVGQQVDVFIQADR